MRGRGETIAYVLSDFDPEENEVFSLFFRKRYWYKPREDFKETDLTEIQRENVKKISEYEEKLKEVLKK